MSIVHSRKLVTISKGHLCFFCPGCKELHTIVVGDTEPHVKSPKWNWDGDVNAPTFSPSILVTKPSRADYRCHSYIRNGIWEFLSDCSHSLAGKKIAMVDLPDYILE